MENTLVAIFLLLLLTLTPYLPNVFAQDYTQLSLSEGAKARLGKGRLTSNIAYSPDGKLLAVGSSKGVLLNSNCLTTKSNFCRMQMGGI